MSLVKNITDLSSNSIAWLYTSNVNCSNIILNWKDIERCRDLMSGIYYKSVGVGKVVTLWEHCIYVKDKYKGSDSCYINIETNPDSHQYFLSFFTNVDTVRMWMKGISLEFTPIRSELWSRFLKLIEHNKNIEFTGVSISSLPGH